MSKVARTSVLAALLLTPALAAAQEIRQAGAPVNGTMQPADSAAQAPATVATPAKQIRVRPPSIFTKRDFAITAGFSAGALALLPHDRAITQWTRDPGRLESGAWSSTMEAVETAYEMGPLVAGAGFWIGGLVARNRPVADMGFHTLAVLGVNQQVTHMLKGAFGRSRPYVSGDSLSSDWRFGSGFAAGTDRRSFPSGHTSQAFAFATVMSHEISRNWPRAGKIATPLLFAGATGAGVARIYHDKHWASDVAVGAALGMLNANATLRFLHGRPNNWLDRLAHNTTIMPNAEGGATVAVSFKTK